MTFMHKATDEWSLRWASQVMNCPYCDNQERLRAKTISSCLLCRGRLWVIKSVLLDFDGTSIRVRKGIIDALRC